MLTAGIHGNYLSGMQQLSLAKGRYCTHLIPPKTYRI